MKKVITYGTFDLFHQGHYNILKRAKEYGDYLIVGVTGESYDIERGKLSVQDSLLTRIENVKKTGLVDQVIVEEYLGQKTQDIINYNIDTFVIGSDWMGKFDHLRQYCNVVYLERTKNISSTQLRQQTGTIYRVGIVTDTASDGTIMEEAKNVSGVHVESVFCEDIKVAEKVRDEYLLDLAYDNYDQFLDSVDIVFIITKLEARYEMICRALEQRKHVIADTPFSLDKDKSTRLIETAEQNNVALLENMVLVYLRAFNQLLWMAQGNLIGSLLNVKASISADSFENSSEFLDLAKLSICAMIKLLGPDYQSMRKRLFHDTKGRLTYCLLNFEYASTSAWLEIGTETEFENHLIIIGDKGSIIVKDDWWNTGYFELKNNGRKHVKKYSFNFEGSGIRYLLQELLIMLKDNRTQSTRLFPAEAEVMTSILEKIMETEKSVNVCKQ